jgi:low affinity Fe/Cu permease
MKKPSKEEIIEALVLVIATAVAILIFTTTFVIARAIVQSVF